MSRTPPAIYIKQVEEPHLGRYTFEIMVDISNNPDLPCIATYETPKTYNSYAEAKAGAIEFVNVILLNLFK